MSIPKPLISFLSIAVLVSVGIGVVWWNFEARRHGTDIPAGEIYAALLSKPVPETVVNLQAAGTTWQGYSLYLRFRASSLHSAGITTPPYQAVDCVAILSRLTLPATIHSTFSPEWTVPDPENGSCFEALEIGNGWTKLGSHYVMKSGEWIYFAGFGS